MKDFIQYGKQTIDEDDINAVVQVLKSNYLTTGPKISEFEKRLADYVGSKYAVAVSNGTAALHTACFAAKIGNDDEVITSPMTFAASVNCILYCGACPVFADIESDTLNIDAKDIEKKITNRTKAIIPVHFSGRPCDMDSIKKLAQKYNLKVIEDAAHALGAKYKQRKVGSISDMTTFSFHPVKPITTGEGGAITTDSLELYEKLKLFRSHGITRGKGESWYYEQTELGYNYRITDIQAALGISQLNKLDKFLQRRRELVSIYNRGFSDIKQLTIPTDDNDFCSSWHIYVLRFNLDVMKIDRNTVFRELYKRNIGVNIHYIPVYFHPYYQKLGYNKGLCKNVEAEFERIITLPLHQGMEDTDVEYIIENVRQIVHFARN